MKKIFAIVAVLCLALTANANILWEETFDKNGSTYVEKNSEGYWPYASSTKEGQYVFENYSTDYSSIKSYSCSVRSKKLNGSNDNTPGFYFGLGKSGALQEAKDCYLTLEYNFVADGTGLFLEFEVSTDQTVKDKDLSTLAVKINDQAAEVPATAFPAKGTTATIQIALPAGAISKLHWEWEKIQQQVFLSHPRITDGAQAIDNIFVDSPKAVKVMENGQMVIIRNGVKYNATGAVIE